MANKYLDQGGLTHLWDKIKSYLEAWKTSNFGTGTYSNIGSIDIYAGSMVSFSKTVALFGGVSGLNTTRSILLQSGNTLYMMIDGDESELTPVLQMYCNALSIGIMRADSSGNVTVNPRGATVKYLTIASSGVKYNTLSGSSNQTITVGEAYTPAIIIGLTGSGQTPDGP